MTEKYFLLDEVWSQEFLQKSFSDKIRFISNLMQGELAQMVERSLSMREVR